MADEGKRESAVSDGDAQNPAGKPWGALVPASPPVDPELWRREDMRAALRAHLLWG